MYRATKKNTTPQREFPVGDSPLHALYKGRLVIFWLLRKRETSARIAPVRNGRSERTSLSVYIEYVTIPSKHKKRRVGVNDAVTPRTR